MFDWLRSFLRTGLQDDAVPLEMPEVRVLPHIEEVFREVRAVAVGEEVALGDGKGRYVVLVPPDRHWVAVPCPAAGSMPAEDVNDMEELLPSRAKKKIAVIAPPVAHAVASVATGVSKINASIPFFGLLTGLAYIGHAVWVFEGHRSALAAGCKQADALIVDSAMLPLLQRDWMEVAAEVMNNYAVYVHDRSTFSLQFLG